MIALLRRIIAATEPRPEPGIYFLLDAVGLVLYVGQSDNVLNRMSGHKVKAFASVRMIQVPLAEDRNRLEQQFIHLLVPPLNVQRVGFNEVRKLLSGARSVPHNDELTLMEDPEPLDLSRKRASASD